MRWSSFSRTSRARCARCWWRKSRSCGSTVGGSSARSPARETELPAELVLLAAGFVGTDVPELLAELGTATEPRRGTITIDDGWRTTAEGVYACGDATRGASLVVWAIAEGRACAAAVDAALMGGSDLPQPVRANAMIRSL